MKNDTPNKGVEPWDRNKPGTNPAPPVRPADSGNNTNPPRKPPAPSDG